MEIQFINQLLKVLKEAMEWLQQLYEAAQRGGLPSFSLLPPKSAVELTTAHSDFPDDETIRIAYRRMLGRNRQRRYRQRQRQARENYKTAAASEATIANAEKAVTADVTGVTKTESAVTGDAKPVTCDAGNTTRDADSVTGDAVTQNSDDSVTQRNASTKKEKENEKRKKQRKEINKNKKTKPLIADAMPNSARTHTREDDENGLLNETGSCLPFLPPEKKTSKLIPINDLSEMHRKVVLAWNKLPLPKKLSGLFPTMVRQLNNLFENYGEETVHEAIARVADSPFLLGRSKNNRGWVANLYWLLQPENLEKILSGQYQDDAPRSRQGEISPTVPEGFYGTVVY